MERLCGLAPDINRCPYYIEDTGRCGANHTDCGFYQKTEAKKEVSHQRQTKWFEQYYK